MSFARGLLLAAIAAGLLPCSSEPSVAAPAVKSRARISRVIPLAARRLAAQDESFAVWAPAPASSRITLRFGLSGELTVAVFLPDGKKLPFRVEKGDEIRNVYATVPANHPSGGKIKFRFKAVNGPAEARDMTLIVQLADFNGNGIGDSIEKLMSPDGRSRVFPVPLPNGPRTSFQTAQAYAPEFAVPADSVLVYSSESSVIRSWKDRGYDTRTMGGFRAGADYAREHPDEAQTDRDGRPIEIGGQSFYLTPTNNRITAALGYYDSALRAGSDGICPEEPEYWSRAGYEEAFKREWVQRYRSDWMPPHSSAEARWKSEELKAFLERRQIDAIMERARSVKPEAVRMIAIHSPINYPLWGIVSPHYEIFQNPALQEVIGQVWTGTARSAVKAGGVRAERAFELAMLEYNSLVNLTRDSGKRLWFLMDPIEDNPNLPLEDYRRNYHQTLLAALMNPAVDRFEVMPWPQRIYGKVGEEYATEINTVVGMLADLWRYPNGRVDAGSRGIAAAFADSMGRLRGEPSPADLDGFTGMTVPFIQRGAPIDLISLDRIAEPGYLNSTRALLLSYDFLKPRGPEIHAALATWVKQGGSLILFGGTDAYNGIPDSWWVKAGSATPTEHLLSSLGISVKEPKVAAGSENPLPWQELLRGDPAERELKNRKKHVVDLSPLTKANGSVSIRFEDVTSTDGWGPYVAAAELRVNGRLAASFLTGSELETRFLEEEKSSRYDGRGRYADGDGHWSYRFENLPKEGTVTLSLDMGNGFLVKARPAAPLPVLTGAPQAVPPLYSRLRIPRGFPMTLYAPPAGSTPLYTLAGESAPPVWEAPVEKGMVTFCGVGPGYLASNAVGSRWVRWLAQRALNRAGGKYEEQPYFRVTRGPYTAIRALGKPYTLSGTYINLLDSTLPVVESPSHDHREWGLYLDAGAQKESPTLMAASGRLRARAESESETSWLVQAPSGPTGAARVYTAGKRIAAIRAFTTVGTPIPYTTSPSGDTVLIKHPNDADGVVIRVVWQ